MALVWIFCSMGENLYWFRPGGFWLLGSWLEENADYTDLAEVHGSFQLR